MKFKSFHINLKIRIIQNFVSASINTMIFPFMAIYFTLQFGAKLTGVLLIINILIGIFMSLLGGQLGDVLGRKNIIIISETGRFIAFTGMTLANSPFFSSPWITFTMLAFNSLFSGLSGPAMQAMIIDVTNEINRKQIYRISYWTTNLSIVIGSIVGGLLFKEYLFELFFCLSFISLISLIVFVLFLQEVYEPKKVQEKPSLKAYINSLFTNYKLVLKDKVYLFFFLGSILSLAIELQLTSYIGVRLQSDFPSSKFLLFNYTFEVNGISVLGFLRSENTLLVVLFSIFITGKLFKKYDESKLLYIGLVLFTVGYSVITVSNNLLILIFFMLVATVGEVLYVPVKQTLLAKIPPNNLRSTYLGVQSLVFRISAILASLFIIIGSFIDSWVMSIFFVVMGISSLFLFYRVFLMIKSGNS